MNVRFFMLQTHYRSTLDFSNEALQAAEKGLKRLWDAYENLKQLVGSGVPIAIGRLVGNTSELDTALNTKVLKLLTEFDEHMNDDFNTARVLASMFELVPVINSIKDKTIPISALSADTLQLMQAKFKSYLEDVFGLQAVNEADNAKLQGVMQLLIDIRKEAKGKKDFATSDKIRNQLAGLGIALKDEKGGEMSWSLE
jgi:cysteinyl-tRNA synthetase